MSKIPYIKLDKNKVIKYYGSHTLIECSKEFNCSEETIKRRLTLWNNLRTKGESLRMFWKSDRSKNWRLKKSKFQKEKYKRYGQKMFSEKFKNNICSFNKRKNSFRGNENGRWNGGNSPKYWRLRVMAEYGEECNICKWKKIPEVLEAHHKDYNRKNNTIENGQVLCPNCHRIIHFQERGFK